MPMTKVAYWINTDAEARKLGEQTGLDTLVVLAVNDDYWVWVKVRFSFMYSGNKWRRLLVA